jgi:2-polyprenyl-6-methoxyphenol hydroxylase-like FAD-dependent oxidoreductase
MVGTSDVVVVGGGIGGAALAYALAGGGLGVTVLEASSEYEDRVRGENLQPWGLQEARTLGIEQAMLDAGAHITTLSKQYDETGSPATDIPLSIMVPGIPGSLNLRHPDACQALIDAATGAGVTVVRNVSDVKLTSGPSPGVTYMTGDKSHEITSTIVVGADGRASTVRKQVGITLEKQEPMNYIAGLLVDGLHDVPDDHDVLAGEGQLFFLMFHQGGGRARLYLVCGLSGQHRFAGRHATQHFLDSCKIASYPWAESVAAGTPAGPCKTYPGDDTWTDTPYADGVVLIGDAAGHNDPIVGQGLSIALRDARIVRDLILDGARKPADFAPYGKERAARMARLRLVADVLSVTQVEDADNLSARRAFVGKKMAMMDSDLFPILVGAFAGPDTIPQELVDPAILDRIRSA